MGHERHAWMSSECRLNRRKQTPTPWRTFVAWASRRWDFTAVWTQTVVTWTELTVQAQMMYPGTTGVL
jgi:hypothetical protein